MSDPQPAEEYQARYVIENVLEEMKETRADMRSTRALVERARSFSRNWAVVGISVVGAIAGFFLFVLIASGISAIKENTHTVRDLRASSITNKGVLDSILQDREANALRFQILQRQLQSIELRLAPPPPILPRRAPPLLPPRKGKG